MNSYGFYRYSLQCWKTVLHRGAWALIFIALPALVSAHRGPINEADPCNIKVGTDKVHFTAYLPNSTSNKEYCKAIPEVGLTSLVFDYEGKKLRDLSVEFEVTKEPEGTRVFYQEPRMIKTGTVNSTVDFSKFGAGDYLAHVTLVSGGNENVDSHIPFAVGVPEEANFGWLIKIASVLGLIVFIFLFVKWIDREPAQKA